MSLLRLIEQYDRDNQLYINDLCRENAELRAKVKELHDLLDGAMANVEAYKLRWILSMPEGMTEDPLAKLRKPAASDPDECSAGPAPKPKRKNKRKVLR